jgi:hypothetical protein
MALPRARGTATAADIVDERQEVIRGELEGGSFEHAVTHAAISAVLGTLDGRSRPGRIGGWWLGLSVEIELEAHEVYLPDVAGWRIDHAPDPPSGKSVRIRPRATPRARGTATAADILDERQEVIRGELEPKAAAAAQGSQPRLWIGPT